MIELKNVSKVFGKKQNTFKALDDISLTIPDASTVAIVGKSGSGKSTLMHAMSGLDPATSGSIKIGSKLLNEMNPKEIDRFRSTDMSFIFQSFFIEANQSCLNNVLLPLEIARTPIGKRKSLALAALDSVELSDKISTKARNLSGGQKQRLAIARATVLKPKIIFADEPTGNLDSATGEKIIKLLFDLNKSIAATLVIVTHDQDLASRCKMRIYLKDGKLEKIEGIKIRKKI
jgi:putative ABC transport system ATP-binding protein